jgi:hypothetical protein
MTDLFKTLTDKNFELFAAHNYNNLQCMDVDEFKQDLKRFKYLKRLLRRYTEKGDLQERLILNHLIILHNVFGIEPAHRMLIFKSDTEHYEVLKPFLVFLHVLPKDAMLETGMDNNIIQVLRNI